ncbi:MAG TPA: hypothetical protein VF140_06320 [Phycicoccus sp.]
MSRLLRLLAAVAVVVAATPAGVGPALAHGSEQGLAVEPAAAAPGGWISVRGDLPTTSSVTLVLVGPRGQRIGLASVDDPADGHFETGVLLPAAATPGSWRLQALSGGSLLAEHEVAVVAAGGGQEEDARLQQAEPVTAPPGTAAPALRPDTAALRAGPDEGSPPEPPGAPVSLAAGSAAVVGVGALAVAFAARRRRAGRS